MHQRLDDLKVSHGGLVLAKDMSAALTAAPLGFGDGATQTFSPDGRTTYIEDGRPTQGEWSVLEDGKFSSFWPPHYRAIYALRWIVEGQSVAGLSFTQVASGDRSEGRYH